ncbi:MAG: helix-turn-helix domain-containing protein [Haloarculaceae archaeon]
MSSVATDAAGSDGIQVELVVTRPCECPIAATSAGGDAVVRDVSQFAAGDGASITEFTVAAGDPPADADATTVYEGPSGTRYRYRCERECECVSATVQRFGCPVEDVRARDGDLHLTFYVASMETLREVVAALRAGHDGVHVRRLRRSGDLVTDGAGLDGTPLTERQREVLETAYDLGYFEYPKDANASEVAAELGISQSTFAEHLAAAQAKLVGPLFEG